MSKELAILELLETLERYDFGDYPAIPKVLWFALPKEVFDSQLENWVRAVLASNDELMAALQRLLDLCTSTEFKEPAKNHDVILSQARKALSNAARAKNLA
jgi:hypothetical protein